MISINIFNNNPKILQESRTNCKIMVIKFLKRRDEFKIHTEKTKKVWRRPSIFEVSNFDKCFYQ